MSLPIPPTGGNHVFDPRELAEMEAPLIALANRSGGDLRKLLYAFFSFLHRRTDFYMVHPSEGSSTSDSSSNYSMGFREGDAEKMLLAAFRQFPLRRIPPSKSQPKSQPQPRSSSTSSNPKTSSSSSSPPPSSSSSQQTTQAEPAPAVSSATTSSGTSTTNTKDQSAVTAASTTTSVSATTRSEPSNIKSTSSSSSRTPKIPSNKSGGAADAVVVTAAAAAVEEDKKVAVQAARAVVRYTEEGLQIPVGNGGSTDRYKWTQTLDECTVSIEIFGGGVGVGNLGGSTRSCRAKDWQVDFAPESISVVALVQAKDDKDKGDGNAVVDSPSSSNIVLLEGTLAGKVIPSESTWTLEDDGRVLVLVLYKRIKTFWKTILVGDEMIDTSLVDSRRHIDEYDDSTQAQIRKIMYDQSHQKIGKELLPTSNEEQTGGVKQNPPIPPLPPGVEYIDQKMLDEKTPKK